MMKLIFRIAGAAATVLSLEGGATHADGSGEPKAVSSRDGEYFDRNGNPTFNIAEDGTVDWYTYEGYRRYGANCQQCHGPDGLGSSFVPSLIEAVRSLSYGDFASIVADGKRDVNTGQQLVMPALRTNPNVMCYIDAIYVYLRARSHGALGPQRPDKHEPRPHAFTTAKDSCMN